jgi:hypothetical protein
MPVRRPAWTAATVTIALAGVAVRAHALGHWGFSTDEAWVALMTRTTDARQLWLSFGTSPLGWGGLVWLCHLLPLAPETALRVVPCVAGCLCLWAAWRGGDRFAGHPVGGIAAMVVIAFDPLSVGYAKFLKPYTTEVLLALLAVERVGTYAETGRPRDLDILCVILCLGLPFSQGHLLLGPPLLASLGTIAVVRGERRQAASIGVAALLVGVVAGLYYVALIAPRMVPGLDTYWSRQTYLPATNPMRALALLHQRARIDLGRFLGPWLVVPSLVALAAVAPTTRRRAAIVLALALLVVELTALSMAHMVPVSQPRVLLFAHATLAAYGAAAIATAARIVGRRPPVIGWALLVLVAAAWAVPHPWSRVGPTVGVEEVRSLVRVIETNRRPTDRVLVHQSALFPYAYHQRWMGRLLPAGTGTGFIPGLGDPRAAVVGPATVRGQAIRALRDAPRVWLIGSRLRPSLVASIRRELEAAGRVTLERHAPGAFLFLVERARRPDVTRAPARTP